MFNRFVVKNGEVWCFNPWGELAAVISEDGEYVKLEWQFTGEEERFLSTDDAMERFSFEIDNDSNFKEG